MVELLSVLSILIGGSLLLRSAGITGWGLLPLGFLTGLALFVTIGLLQVVTGLPTTPVVTLLLTAALPATWWLLRLLQGHDVAISAGSTTHTLVTVVLLVIVLRGANLVSWHVDSYRYVMAGALLTDGHYRELVSENLLTKRLFSIPVLHSPAILADEYYLRSLVPLLALATIGTLVWFYLNGVSDRVGPVVLVAFAALGVLLLITNNRFVFHAFYINGHLLFAALLLVIAGCAWLLVSDRPVPAPGLVTMLLVATPALVVTRAEAFLVAVCALLPLILSTHVALRHRMYALAVLGSSTVVWHGLIAVIQLARGSSVPVPAAGGLASGVLMLLLLPVLLWKGMAQLGRPALVATEALLWLGLIMVAIRDPEILRTSLSATAENVIGGAGSWGLSLALLAALVAGALLLTSAPAQAFLRFPLTTFVPLALLLAYLRGSPFRVGEGDSLNRMLIQVVPLAVLYLIVAMSSGRWRQSWMVRSLTPAHDQRAADLTSAGTSQVAGTGRPSVPLAEEVAAGQLQSEGGGEIQRGAATLSFR